MYVIFIVPASSYEVVAMPITKKDKFLLKAGVEKYDSFCSGSLKSHSIHLKKETLLNDMDIHIYI